MILLKHCCFVPIYVNKTVKVCLAGVAPKENGKFTEEEIKLLTNLIIKKPPATKLGVRLAATGLCVLIACNILLSHQVTCDNVAPGG